MKKVYDTANFYHFIHTVALLAVPLSRKPVLVSEEYINRICMADMELPRSKVRELMNPLYTRRLKNQYRDTDMKIGVLNWPWKFGMELH